MTPGENDPSRLRPLTKRKQDTGEAYRRRAEVERQLNDLLPLDRAVVLRALDIRDRDCEGYIFDETLVYFIREAHSAGDDDLTNDLYLELDLRMHRLLGRFKYLFQTNPSDFEDFAQKIATAMLGKLFGGDSADYAEVNFGDFVVMAAETEKRVFLRHIERDKLFVAPPEDEENETAFENLFRSGELAIDRKLSLREAIGKLPPQILHAAVLYYLDGWQIESNSPSVATISGYFGVSSRTIRNWLMKPEKILSDYRGETR